MLFSFNRYVTLVFLLSTITAAHAADAVKPNVIVILADDLGLGDYSAYGTKDISTPAIDRLCREGTSFTNFRANSCVCSPTRAALLTGCYPDRVGVPGVIRHTPENSWGWLSPNAVLLPQVLKTAGYHSALIGKWHLGLASPNEPNERGFDFFHGFLGDMMDDYETHLRGGQNFMRRNKELIDPRGHATELFTDWACEYVTDRATVEKQSKERSPFFLYLAYNAPHDPIQPGTEWLERVKRREPRMHPKRAGLVALIEQMDSGIGKLLEKLDQLSLRDNTLIFFTSDNGGILGHGANNGPWRSEKQHFYEGGIRVPAIARWPGQIPANRHLNRSALTMDLFPTIAEAAGVKVDPTIDGISFLSSLQQSGDNAPGLSDREFYFVRREGGINYGGKTIEALIQGDWKIIQDNPFGPLELYNLKTDPNEAKNVATEEKQIFQAMAAKLRLHIQHGGKVKWQE